MSKEMEVVGYLLDLAGIGAGRLQVRWVSASEGHLFAGHVKEYTEEIRRLGPFEAEDFEVPLDAVRGALKSSRLRWLMGMEIQVTDRGNVYGERLDQEAYRTFLYGAAQQEYEQALIQKTLENGPQTVRDIALETGLPVYTVSRRLNELERSRLAEFGGYEGRTPKFVRMGG